MSSLPLRLVSCIGWRAAFQPFTPSLLQVVKDHTAVAALTRLTSLMHLAVGGRVFVDKAAGLMAQLTQLQFLEWVHTDVTSRGLHALTALTNLDTLSVLDCPYVREEGLSAIELCTSPEAEAAQLPGMNDVWLQPAELHNMCSHDSQQSLLQASTFLGAM